MPEVFMGGLPKDADLLEALTDVCRKNGITKGTVQCIGALTRAKLAFYHQDTKEYTDHEIDKPLEILAGLGSVSIKDNEPMVHLHLTLSDEKYQCMGGHAAPGCTIFACEAYITPVGGEPLVRGFDEPTGLPLWKKQAK